MSSKFLPFAMIKNYLFVLIASVILMLATPALAGTWKIDFEDGNLDDWEVIKAEEIKKMNPGWIIVGLGVSLEEKAWSVENGILVGKNMGGFDGIAIGDASWTDYSVQANIKILEATPVLQHGASIFLRFADINRFYGATIDPPPLDTQVVALRHPKIVDNLFAFLGVFWGIKLNTWYKLKLVAKGAHFDVYLDDVLVTAFDDDTVASGRAGLFIIKAHAHFDDVIITGDEIPDGGPSAIEPKSKLVTTWGKMKQAR